MVDIQRSCWNGKKLRNDRWTNRLDIPTNSIPPDLRTIGSRFLLSRLRLDPDEHDSFEQIRRIYPTLQIVKLV